MKKQIFKTLILSCIAINNFSQIKVVSNGNVAIGGISYPNHSLHVWGYSQLFNFNNKEIQFRPNDQYGNNYYCSIGSNLGTISFYNPSWGYNRLIRSTCVTNSDERVKRNITSINTPLATIKNLQPKKFQYVDSIIPGGKFYYGFIAQQVGQYIPELVDTSGKYGFLTLNYEGIIPFLVGAVKEQAVTIDSLRAASQHSNGARATNTTNTNEITILKQQLEELKTKVNYFENNCCATINTGNGGLIDNKNSLTNSAGNSTDDFYLQNMPNPFENTTTIKFNIPNKYNGTFYIKVFKISGEELMSNKVQKQDKELLINASNLVNGVYNYALIVNSDMLQMKQMIISR